MLIFLLSPQFSCVLASISPVFSPLSQNSILWANNLGAQQPAVIMPLWRNPKLPALQGQQSPPQNWDTRPEADSKTFLATLSAADLAAIEVFADEEKKLRPDVQEMAKRIFAVAKANNFPGSAADCEDLFAASLVLAGRMYVRDVLS